MKSASDNTGEFEASGTNYGQAMAEGHRLRSEAFHGLVVRPVAGAARALVAAIAEQYRRARTIHALQALSDHGLDDIGLSRGEIQSVATRLVSSRSSAPVRAPVEARLRVVDTRAAANDDPDVPAMSAA